MAKYIRLNKNIELMGLMPKSERDLFQDIRSNP